MSQNIAILGDFLSFYKVLNEWMSRGCTHCAGVLQKEFESYSQANHFLSNFVCYFRSKTPIFREKIYMNLIHKQRCYEIKIGCFLDKLPDVLDEKQKHNKIKNILYAMSKKDKTIVISGTSQKGNWVLSNSKI